MNTLTPNERRTLECLRDLYWCPDIDFPGAAAMFLDHLEAIGDPRVQEAKERLSIGYNFVTMKIRLGVRKLFVHACEKCEGYGVLANPPETCCPACDGSGMVLDPVTVRCKWCRGRGLVENQSTRLAARFDYNNVSCFSCNGVGRIAHTLMSDTQANEEAARRWGEHGMTFCESEHGKLRTCVVLWRNVPDVPIKALAGRGLTWEEAFAGVERQILARAEALKPFTGGNAAQVVCSQGVEAVGEN